MIKVLKPGMFSTIQDKGRFGYGEYGVPKSGAMDLYSAELANTLLGNARTDAVLEITMTGPKLKFEAESYIVICGADISPSINGEIIQNNKVYSILKGDILEFGKLKSGLRSYIAVKGGYKTEKVLGSQSYYKPITINDSITEGDALSFNQLTTKLKPSKLFSKLKPIDFSSEVLDVLKGPEFELLSNLQKDQLKSTQFMVSKLYNRMAYQLLPQINNDLKSILTGPVLPGTVQLTPSGRLIVLMRDCQTTGGYPRVLQLTESAINLLSQKKEKDKVIFSLVD
ncbi:biotin-dependent carboxyltransferase family protein [Winogradskyella haliclonae]|uniref:Urea amidolyase n=1 Tax=Winogradskyella haliclonae TaxID=2048558 RepID=A0ABQ2C0U8_9FLAO|nr:biotin-dependent carboxyltransferase family protein [Winogradskyella haliclonae]GGI57830.1 urea amidolyase [Winogradskyella haliclonae]